MKNCKIAENNYYNYLENCLDDKGFIYNINKIIRSKNKLFLEKFYYFIACFSRTLEKVNYGLKESYQLFRGDKMYYKDLIKFKNNINEIIIFKGYLSASYLREVAAVYSKNLWK